ncbi:hypothetical protein K7432_003215 [Basidiobolus ranarum]|uniref:Uncharacterized protein n=1 Tax=Basidiobolus ranarum TaxID=34480 RepID=A0ABR2W6I9_9FUNG
MIFKYPILALSFGISVCGQSTVTVEYPFQTLTRNVAPELITATIQAHTQRDTVPGFIATDIIPDTTYTDLAGLQSVTRVISGSTVTRINPEGVIVQSIPEVTITRSLEFLTATDTVFKTYATYTPTSGEILDYYTITGPTFGNSYIYSIIASYDRRRVIQTISGPTLTYVVGDRDPVIATVDGALSTLYNNPITILETLGPTRVTRNVEPGMSTIVGVTSLSYTPTSFVSVSVSTATVTVTSNAISWLTSNYAPTSTTSMSKSILPTSYCSTPKPTKCIYKPRKCAPKTSTNN